MARTEGVLDREQSHGSAIAPCRNLPGHETSTARWSTPRSPTRPSGARAPPTTSVMRNRLKPDNTPAAPPECANTLTRFEIPLTARCVLYGRPCSHLFLSGNSRSPSHTVERMMERQSRRALRRTHAARIKRSVVGYYDGWARASNCPDRVLGRLVATRTPCSCWMCGNPRRYLREPTMQEFRAFGRRRRFSRSAFGCGDGLESRAV
jgi:hypothetical protein